MKYSKILLILFTGLVLSLGASEAKKAIEKRIAPVGSVCVQGEDCGSTSAATTIVAYSGACATCHNIGVAGAPKFADATSWGARPDKGIEALTASVKNGLNGMPAMGLCMDCSDDELSAAVQHMLDSI
jgi:cytochrome c5